MLEINYAWAFKLWNKSQKNMKTIIPHIYFGRGPPCPNSKDASPQERLARSWWGVWLNTPRDGQMGEMRWMTIFLPVITIVTTWMPWETFHSQAIHPPQLHSSIFSFPWCVEPKLHPFLARGEASSEFGHGGPLSNQIGRYSVSPLFLFRF